MEIHQPLESPELLRDLASYNQLLRLWSQENSIKTTKFQVLLATNTGLLAVVVITGGFTHYNWPLYLGGMFLSLVWTLSIGRTVLFQKHWQARLHSIAEKHADDPRFHILGSTVAIRHLPLWLRMIGGVSSKYYLMGTPIILCVGWLLAWMLASGL
ncbi:MAG: hypothetical protein ACE5FH_03460 [Candidatus Zixiibacteriota bacterium]